jgi:hypothetical protein
MKEKDKERNADEDHKSEQEKSYINKDAKERGEHNKKRASVFLSPDSFRYKRPPKKDTFDHQIFQKHRDVASSNAQISSLT